MIDSLSFLLLTLISVGLSQVFLARSAIHRLFWIVLPGTTLLYAVHPKALLYALACLITSFVLYGIGRSSKSVRIKTRLPYIMFIFLFLPDGFNIIQTQPILYLGAAFFIIRQMMTLSEALKKNIDFNKFLPSTLIATFFFAALPSGPVFSGLDIWQQLKERNCAAYQEGTYRLFEGFVCLFALAGFANIGVEFLNTLDLNSNNIFVATYYNFLHVTLVSLVSFGFLFATFYGYSRMAEGAALLMGFSVPQNFDNPHLATDLANFWRRWHRSMANFVMQYIYLPLLVSYKNAKLALVAAFLFMGIWHKFSIEFMVWGLGHGIGLAYALPWLQKHYPSPTFIRIVSLVYILFLSSIAHEIWMP